MEDEFTHEGIWWIVGREDEKVSGTLSRDQDGKLSLSLVNHFSEGDRGIGGVQRVFSRQHEEVIAGKTASGKAFTLFDCMDAGRETSLPTGVGTQRYRPRLSISGILLSDGETLKLRSLSFACTDLAAWIGRNGFEFEREPDLDTFSIRYRWPDPVKAALDDGYELVIGTGYEGPRMSAIQTEAKITESHTVTIRAPEEEEFETLWEKVVQLRHFLSLCVGKPVYITHLEGTSSLRHQIINGEDYYPSLQLYPADLEQPKTHRPIELPHDVLLPLRAIENRLAEAVSAWLQCSSKIQPAIDLYFNTLYEDRIHLENHFLFLAQALETFHRRTSDETDLPEEKHERRISSILEAVPERFSEWLGSKLTFSNEISLRSRIKRIYDTYNVVINGYINKKGRFANDVTTTRHYLTHYNEDLEAAAASGIDLLDLIYKLRTFLEACFLSELGLPESEIAEVLEEKIRERQKIIESNRGRGIR